MKAKLSVFLGWNVHAGIQDMYAAMESMHGKALITMHIWIGSPLYLMDSGVGYSSLADLLA